MYNLVLGEATSPLAARNSASAPAWLLAVSIIARSECYAFRYLRTGTAGAALVERDGRLGLWGTGDCDGGDQYRQPVCGGHNLHAVNDADIAPTIATTMSDQRFFG